MFCKSKSIKCKVIIVILFVLFMISIVFGGIYKKMNNIQDIKNILNKNINNFNMKYIKRNRKIDFKDIIYGLSLKTIYNSYDKVVYEINKNNLNKNNLNKISKSGFIKKQNFINNLDLDNLNNDLLNYIYKNKYEKRVLAVDGSYLKTLSILNNDNLKFSSKKNNYTSYGSL